MKKLKKLFAAIFALTLLSGTVLSCSDDSESEESFTSTPVTFTPVTCTITFNANDGTANPTTTTQAFSTTQSSYGYINSTSVTLNKNTFTRTGYNFLGWSKSSSDSYVSFKDGESAYISGDTTLYAVWGLPSDTYAIVFNGNGGTTSDGATTVTQFVVSSSYSVKATLKANTFTRSGCVFLGWGTSKSSSYISYNDGAEYSFSSSYDSSTTLYAIWESEENIVTVTLNANGGNGENKTITSRKGDSFYFSSYTSFFSHENATLIGWAKSSTATEADYSFADSYYKDKISYKATETTTLYAVWKENPKITFHGNGGTTSEGESETYQYLAGKWEYSLGWGFTPTSSYSSETYKYVYLDENPFTNSGKTFKGWSTSESSTTIAASDKGYYKGFMVTLDFLGLKTWEGTDLYAVWQ